MQRPQANQFRFPAITERTAVVGRTGSGKTQFSSWLLSNAAFDRQPFVMIDYKGDDLLLNIPRVRDLSLTEIPKHAGLYRINPQPQTDDEAVEAWLRRIWQHERIGLYVDEAYMLPAKGGAYNAILTQGRSKRIPVISCSQRPSWISRFVFSEADFIAFFHLNDRDDRSKIKRFISQDAADATERLPPFHSYWYDVKQDHVFLMNPVPDAENILDIFEARLAPKRRFA